MTSQNFSIVSHKIFITSETTLQFYEKARAVLSLSVLFLNQGEFKQ